MSQRELFRYGLGALIAVLAVGAFAGGVYAMAGAPGVPERLLEGGPFATYFVPGLILFAVVGGSLAFAAFALFWRRPLALELAALAGAILLVWTTTQLALVGYLSWLQAALVAIASVILALVYGYSHRHPASPARTQ
jgi:hypothetical protein